MACRTLAWTQACCTIWPLLSTCFATLPIPAFSMAICTLTSFLADWTIWLTKQCNCGAILDIKFIERGHTAVQKPVSQHHDLITWWWCSSFMQDRLHALESLCWKATLLQALSTQSLKFNHNSTTLLSNTFSRSFIKNSGPCVRISFKHLFFNWLNFFEQSDKHFICELHHIRILHSSCFLETLETLNRNIYHGPQLRNELIACLWISRWVLSSLHFRI
mmetsp:Transcript_113338/g.178274  ORF Transcript_113338/g.178274 Transcript_113338/m.178274 type:complete len:219 (-) Transcript_113338:174-830(-)